MAPITSWALSALLLASSALAAPNEKRAVNPTVSIDAGRIIGTATTLPSATAAVNQFLGIPYAAPPVRFEKSVKPTRWLLPKTVQKRGKSCIQQFNYPAEGREFTKAVFSNPPPEESEDCLFLNVFAPSSKAPEGGFPVMFWIYGGALQFGNAGQPAYDGSYLAGFEDVIVVSFNYRTNVFGFPASPELALTNRNLGFFDQRLALSWVQTNIAQFGGNPKKVTIFGESAGALSVDALITTSPTNPPFRAGILQSGQASLAKFIGRTNSTTAWLSLAEKVGCTSGSQLACLKKVDPLKIKDTIERNQLGFNPVADEITFASDPAALRAAKKIANVPIMVGSNANEGRVFNVGQTNLTAYLEETFQIPALINAIRAAYPLGTPGLETEYDVISQIFTDLVFTCPASGNAESSRAAGYDTWRYFYTPTFNNINPALALVGIDLKAWHSAEIPMAFGTYPRTGVTAQQEALSRYMRGAWASFARNPTEGPGWNKLGTYNGTDLGVLGLNGSGGVTVTPKTVADARCALFAPIYATL